MKAYLMAAGKGTRLKPYTDTQPKCLIPINGIALLQIWIDLFERHGVTEVLINTHHHAELVEKFIADYQPKTQAVLQTVFEPQLLGSGGTLWHNRHWVEDEDHFIIAYADNLTNINLTDMVAYHAAAPFEGNILTMGLMHAPDPKECGIATIDDNHRILKFIEKPENPESDLANGGIYIANTQIFDYFPSRIQNESVVFDLGHHVLPRLTGNMYGYLIEDYLIDIGNPEAYHQAKADWAKLG